MVLELACVAGVSVSSPFSARLLLLYQAKTLRARTIPPATQAILESTSALNADTPIRTFRLRPRLQFVFSFENAYFLVLETHRFHCDGVKTQYTLSRGVARGSQVACVLPPLEMNKGNNQLSREKSITLFGFVSSVIYRRTK